MKTSKRDASINATPYKIYVLLVQDVLTIILIYRAIVLEHIMKANSVIFIVSIENILSPLSYPLKYPFIIDLLLFFSVLIL